MRRAAERVADSDVAEPINRGAGHPAVKTIRRIRALLTQPDAAVFVDPKLVPAHAAAAGRSVDRMDGDQRFAARHLTIDEPRHDLVALRVEPPFNSRLRHAVRKLPAAQIMIWSYGDLFRADGFCVGRILPIDFKLPYQDPVIFEDILQLRTAGRHYDVRRAGRRKPIAVNVSVVQEIHSVNDDALLAGRLALEHLCALHDARMLLDHVVSRAGRDVIAVGPDRRSRVVGEERPQKFVARVWAERVGAGADGVAHRERALLAGLLSALAALSAWRLLPRLNRRAWRRNE